METETYVTNRKCVQQNRNLRNITEMTQKLKMYAKKGSDASKRICKQQNGN